MAQQKTIELEVKTDKAIAEIEAVRDELKLLQKTVTDGNEKTEKGLKGVEDASKSTAKGIKAIGTTIKAIGIGLLLEAFNLLKKTLGENQKVLDFFNTTFEFLSLAFNDFINFIDSNFGKFTDFFKGIFENPLESLKEFGKLIKENIIERFNSALEVAGYLADAFKNLFAGEFQAALDSVKNAGVEFLDVLSGVDNSLEVFTEGVKNVSEAVGEYAKSTWNAAEANVELTKQAEIAAITQQGLVEKYDRQAEQLRQIRDDERNSIQERIDANNKLKATLDEQEKAMLRQVDLQIASAAAQYEKNKNQENYVQLLQAQQEKDAVLAQIAGFRSEQMTNEMSLQREQIDLIKSQQEAAEDLSMSQKTFNAEQIENEVLRLEALNQIYADEDAAKLARLEADIELYKEGTQARVDAETAYAQFAEESRQKQIDNELKLTEAIKKSEEEKRASQTATLDNLIAIANEESALGKALLVAKQILSAREAIIEAQASARKAASAVADASVKAAGAGVDISTGAAKTASSAAFPLNVPLIIAYAAQAVGIIASIRSATSKMKSAIPSGGGISIAAPSIPQATVPQVNTVGSSGVNQLASVVESSMNRPVKAFVVSKDVSTAQEMDRNIIREAGI